MGILTISSIDKYSRSCDKWCIIWREKSTYRCYFFWFSPSSEVYFFGFFFSHFWRESIVHARIYPSRCDTIDSDIVLSEFLREITREDDDTSFWAIIMSRYRREAIDRIRWWYEYHTARSIISSHDESCIFRHEKCANQIGLEDFLPLIDTLIIQGSIWWYTRAVSEYIYTIKWLENELKECFYWRFISDIAGICLSTYTMRSECLESLLSLARIPTRCDDDISSEWGKSQCCRTTDALGTACYDDDFMSEW